MRFDTSEIEHLIPEIDNLHWYCRINHGLGGKGKKYPALLQERFDLFRELLEEDAGPLEKKIWNTDRKTDKEDGTKQKKKTELVFISPACGFYVHGPNRHGWCYVHFEPNTKNLELFQRWLLSFYGSRHVLERNVSLKRIEFSYDIFFEGGIAPDYAALALRIGRHIWPKHATNTFAVAIVGEETKKDDGAANGALTLYTQSCKRPDRFKLSKVLDYNTRATRHSKIYPKAVDDTWFLRIECSLSGPKAKSLVQYDNFPGLLESVKLFPFGELFTFKDFDFQKFLSFLPEPRPRLPKRVPDAEYFPVVDTLRVVSTAAPHYGIAKKINRCIQTITFDEVVNTPLPDRFQISQRKGENPLPDDLPDGGQVVKLQGFWNVHAKVRKSQPEPLKQQCLFGLVAGQNCAYLRFWKCTGESYCDLGFECSEGHFCNPEMTIHTEQYSGRGNAG